MNPNHFVTRPAFLAAIAALVVIVLPRSSATAPLVTEADIVACGTDSSWRTVNVGDFEDEGPYPDKDTAKAAAVDPIVISALGLRLNWSPFLGTQCDGCNGTGCVGGPFSIDESQAGMQASVYQDGTGQWWVRMTVVGAWTMAYECTPCVGGTD